jgi:starvation-inducible outer membrane lipoprotein
MRVLFVVLCLLLTGCSTSFKFNKEEFEQRRKV